MDFKELAQAVLQYAIANIPTLILLVVTYATEKKKLEGEVVEIKNSLLGNKEEIVNKIEGKFNDIIENVDKRIEKTIDKVDKVMTDTLEKVETFADELKEQKNQIEHLFKTNKIAQEVISLLVSGNETLVRDGVATKIVNKLALTKEEIEKYPHLISTDKEAFIKAVKEQYVMLGKEQFEEMILQTLKEIVYGK